MEHLEHRWEPSTLTLDSFLPASLANAQPAARRELVLIDPDVPDRGSLLQDLRTAAGAEVVLLTGGGVAEITAVLGERTGLNAVHVLSHGRAGELTLGSDRIDAATFDRYAPDVAAWAASLDAGADLLFYGCDLAAGPTGSALIDRFATLIDADVAASTDATGAAALGGDWRLEYRTGPIEAATAAAAGWEHTLPTVTFAQGVNGYTGTFDTFLEENNPNKASGNQDDVFAEGGSPSYQGLLRFDNLFGTGAGQIPPGSTITDANLVVYVTSTASATQVAFHRMKASWTEQTTWNGLGNGIQRDGVEAVATADVTYTGTNASGSRTIGGFTAAVQSWSDGLPNLGWAFFSTNDKWGVNTSEKNDNKAPRLVVTYTAAASTPPAAAADDSYTGTEDAPLTVAPALGLLANDQGPLGSVLSASLVAGPANGSVAVNANGGFTYTPDANFAGADAFTYRLSVAGLPLPVPATVRLTVTPVNDAPTFALAGNPPAIDEDAGPQAIPGFATALDAGPNEGGQSLAFVVTGNTNPGLFATTPAIAPDGTLTYTPAADLSGSAVVTVVLRDNGGTANGGRDTSSPQQFRITVRPVNDPPTLNTPADLTIAEDSGPRTISLTGITAGGGVVQALRVTAASGNPLLILPPAVTYTSPNATAAVTLTPVPDAHGTTTITLSVRDAGLNGFLGDPDDAVTVRTFRVTVTLTDDPPAARPDAYPVVANTPRTGNVLANDADADGDPLTAVLAAGPVNGNLVLQADGSFAYTPLPGFSGTDAFTYRAADPAGNRSAPTTVTLSVGLANRPPAAAADAFTTDEDTPLAATVLANDADPDGDTLSATLQSGPAHGTLVLRTDGRFIYTPAANYGGADAFTYRVADGNGGFDTATVTLTVTPVDDPPTAADDAATVAEGGAVVIDVRANDADAEGDPLTVAAVTAPRNGTATTDGATVVYTPDPNFDGTDAFTYTVVDGRGGWATAAVTVTVTPVNNPPTLDPLDDVTVPANGRTRAVLLTGITAGAGETQPLRVTAVSSDPTVVADPTVAYLSPGRLGLLFFTPQPGAAGTAVLTVTVSDGVATVRQSFTVSVTAANRRPTISQLADQTVPEGGGVGPLAFTVGDAETPADALTVTAASANQQLVADAAIVVTPTGGGGYQLSIVPTPGGTGVAVITVAVSDGTATAETQFVVRVTAANRVPVAADDAFLVPFGVPLTVSAAGVLANDFDADGDAIVTELIDPPQHGRLRLNADGSFVYTPGVGFHGTDTFAYRTIDAAGGVSEAATVTLRVGSPPPAAADDEYAVEANALHVFRRNGVLANDGAVVSAALVTGPAHGTLFLGRRGGFLYVPAADFTGTDSFTYRATDANGTASAAATVTLRVADAGVERYTIAHDAVLAVAGLFAADDELAFAVDLVADAAHGTVVLAADGSFTYAPKAGFAGTDGLTFRVSDGTTELLRTVRITVQPAAAPPPVARPQPAPKPQPEPITAAAPLAAAASPAVAVVASPVAEPAPAPAGVASGSGEPVRQAKESATASVVALTSVAPAAVPAAVTKAGPQGDERTAEPKPVPAERPAAPPSEPPAGVTVVAPPPAALTPPAAAAPLMVPVAVADAAAVAEAVAGGQDELARELTEAADGRAATDAVVTTGVVVTAGYVLLNTRAVLWFISAFLARPAVWRRFDPIDVIYSWEQDQELGTRPAPAPADGESLQSIVG